jgi:hypothetical protein
MSEGQRKYDVLAGFTKGSLLSRMRVSASNAGMDVEAWILEAVKYGVLRSESVNGAIADYLLKIGHPSIWDEETDVVPCPECSSQEFSVGGRDGDVTCTLCGATLIKCPPEWHDFMDTYRKGDDTDKKEPWEQ